MQVWGSLERQMFGWPGNETCSSSSFWRQGGNLQNGSSWFWVHVLRKYCQVIVYLNLIYLTGRVQAWILVRSSNPCIRIWDHVLLAPILKLFNSVFMQLLSLIKKALYNTNLSSYQHMTVCYCFIHTGTTYCHDEEQTMLKIRTSSKMGCLLVLRSQKWEWRQGDRKRVISWWISLCRVSISISLLRGSLSIFFFILDSQIHRKDSYVQIAVESSQCTWRWKLEDGKRYSSR